LIKAREWQGGEPEEVDTFINGFQRDVLAGEDFGQKEEAASPADGSGGAHAAHLPGGGIVERRELLGVRAGRGRVVCGRRVAAEGVVRPFLVVFGDERRKPALLSAARGGGWPRGFALEDRMELLMRPVLFRMPRGNPFGVDAEANPPDGEAGEAPEAGSGKGRPVVAANAIGQAKGTEGVEEFVLGDGAGVGREGRAAQDIATGGIPQRKGIAERAVTGAEFTL
jgi:hypothetical protein